MLQTAIIIIIIIITYHIAVIIHYHIEKWITLYAI
jgi:hypothetical protein